MNGRLFLFQMEEAPKSVLWDEWDNLFQKFKKIKKRRSFFKMDSKEINFNEDIISDAPEEETEQDVVNDNHDGSDQKKKDLLEGKVNAKYRPLTDLGNAERFVEQHGHKVRYCKEINCWFVFADGRWIQDAGMFIHRLAKNTIKSIYDEAKRPDLSFQDRLDIIAHAEKSSSKGRINAMVDLSKWEEGITLSSQQLDADPWLLNCQNGTLNLKTKELKPHNSEDLITKRVMAPYDPEAKCPVFINFVQKIMNNDTGKIEFLRRALGYALTGETNEQCLFVFHGPGANGKSTVTETIRELLCDYAMHTTSSSLLHSKSSPIRNDVARLNGARFVSAVEIGFGKKLDESLVKQLTGGDQVTARFLYNEYFEYKPKFKLFISANHKPEIRGTDNGVWRRIYLVPFDVTISSDEIDKDLSTKLRHELPGILTWVVQGCYDWQSQGLNPPDSIKAATEDYRMEMDILLSFIEDRCACQPSEKVAVGAMYEAYVKWSDEVCQDTVGKKIFGKLMMQKGFRQSKSNVTRYWNCITILPEITKQ